MAPVDHAAGWIAVSVAWSLAPRQVQTVQLRLPVGSTALQALKGSGLAEQIGADTLDQLSLALWGRACEPDAVLHDQDRLELLRPLVADPKESRRQRYQRDGIKKTRRPPRAARQP
jgi:putative ubiquitin-RnfH superfamily antitoxin RatB of RatAB toxin-antitoxin module